MRLEILSIDKRHLIIMSSRCDLTSHLDKRPAMNVGQWAIAKKVCRGKFANFVREV